MSPFKLAEVIIFSAVTPIIAGCETASSDAENTNEANAAHKFILTELVVPDTVATGYYDVALRFEMVGYPRAERVCFTWSGEGPYCWKGFSVNRRTGLIKTRASTSNPGVYVLSGHVEYRAEGKPIKSNAVSKAINVR